MLRKIRRKGPITSVLNSTEQDQFRDTLRLEKDAKSTGNGRLQGQRHDF